MATNLSSLAPLTTGATALSNLVLVVPNLLASVGQTVGYQPNNPPNPNGTPSTAQQPPALLFNYEGEQSVALESDVTDHYVEDNTAIQDQIALRPITISTHGFIGEVNDIAPQGLKQLQIAANALSAISAYAPVLSATALIAYDEATLLYDTAAQAINSQVSAWSSVSGNNGENVINGNSPTFFNAATGAITGNQSKQQIAFQQFYGYWNNRTFFTVQTPWAVFQNMVIMSLRAIQDEKTTMITDFEVTFKQIRTASVNVAVAPIKAPTASYQSDPGVNLGTQAQGASFTAPSNYAPSSQPSAVLVA